MTKDEFYAQLPRLIRRLFTLGILSAAAFLTVWYLGGLNLWGRVMSPFLNIFSRSGSLQFSPGSTTTAQFLYDFVLEDGRAAQLTFPINQLNSSLLEVVTLLAFWPHKNLKSLLKVTCWCLSFTVLYHCFEVLLQLHATEIGPAVANRYNLFWEESTYYLIIKNISAFDKFILRFWAGFPIFLLALTCNFLVSGSPSKAPATKTKKKKKK